LAWLVLGWVAVCRQVYHLDKIDTSHPGPLSLVITPWILGMQNEYQRKLESKCLCIFGLYGAI